mmetsp:Transcript_9817/g.24035  ORF Transcript_9817/g.24035 Transcript_9817/m.24035 type:complete len:492 (+) Transcript_9817:56-1531(+)
MMMLRNDARLGGAHREHAHLAPVPEREREGSSNPPSPWWQDPCESEAEGADPVDTKEEFNLAAAVAELVLMGKRGGWIVKPGELEVGRQIGHGSVGSVFRGTHVAKGTIVAAKAIREDLTLPAQKRNRALQTLVCEVKAMSKMGTHPGIVGFVGANIDERNSAEAFILIEYMDGGCLRDVLAAQSKNGTPWRPPKATSFSWCAQLCAALKFLHHRSDPLVHRDINAANLFCSADLKTLKLGDFGLCRSIKTLLPQGDDARTTAGMKRTLPHMAPEVFSATAGYSDKSDIFSAAVCMVHLLSGEHAYAGEAELREPELLARRVALEGYRAPLENRIKNVDMRELVVRMWDHEASERPSAAECVLELVALLATATTKSLNPLTVLKRSLTFTPRRTSEPDGSTPDGGTPYTQQPGVARPSDRTKTFSRSFTSYLSIGSSNANLASHGDGSTAWPTGKPPGSEPNGNCSSRSFTVRGSGAGPRSGSGSGSLDTV